MKNGGLITKTINTPTTDLASGVWSLQEQYEAETNDVWPKFVDTSTDPYFSDVILLLKFDGANGGTTFTDSSNNNTTITRNANTVLSNVVTKYGSTSGYFDGAQDNLSFPLITIPLNTDFTIETWFNTADDAANDSALCGTYSGNGGNNQMFRFSKNNTNDFLIYNNGSIFSYTRSTALANNTWYHTALTRENNVCKFFMDGVLEATNSNFSGAIKLAHVGAGYNGTNEFRGYMDEFRITSGVARYTSSFTPPTAGFPTS